MKDRRFIIWNPKEGSSPTYDERGNITSSGLIGWLDVESVSLTTYAQYPDLRRPEHLEVNESIKGVKYSLSGSVGYYDIYRVK